MKKKDCDPDLVSRFKIKFWHFSAEKFYEELQQQEFKTAQQSISPRGNCISQEKKKVIILEKEESVTGVESYFFTNGNGKWIFQTNFAEESCSKCT